LGLIIIDEEQKFGVGVKDKLKTLRTSVDTLDINRNTDSKNFTIFVDGCA
jgi:hypothetical protein